MKSWKLAKTELTIVLLLMSLVIVITACSGDSETATQTPPTQPPATATNIPQPTSTPEPTEVPPTATTPPAPTATTVPDDPMMGGAGDDDILALGKEIFEVSAGGVGCAFCHGLDGQGSGPAGIEAPVNAGASMDMLNTALKGGETEAMTFIKLSTTEKEAVVAYLQTLVP